MKVSYYNFLVNNGNNYILYNSFSDELIVLQPELYKLYVEHINNIEDIQDFHPSFFEYLKNKHFIVPDSEIEPNSVINCWKQKEELSDTFSITINPTMECNMNCWYCYENKRSGKMSQSVALKICKLLNKICQEESQYKNIVLAFFGGEPFLYYETVVKTLIKQTREICNMYKKNLSLRFTTNGFLIDEEKINYLSIDPVSFQITLDGNSVIHNKIKKVANGDDTYTKTIYNIINCVKRQCYVIVRLNFTEQTLPFFVDVLQPFSELSMKEKSYIRFNFQQIWQDCHNQAGLKNNVFEIESLFIKEGFLVTPYSSNGFVRCYADDNYSVVINHDGLVFKCTARSFTKEHCDGILSEDGIIQWNERHNERRKITYGGNTCRECKIFPLCHGGCSQYKLEHLHKYNYCVKNINEDGKIQIVHDRIRDILIRYSKDK